MIKKNLTQKECHNQDEMVKDEVMILFLSDSQLQHISVFQLSSSSGKTGRGQQAYANEPSQFTSLLKSYPKVLNLRRKLRQMRRYQIKFLLNCQQP